MVFKRIVSCAALALTAAVGGVASHLASVNGQATQAEVYPATTTEVMAVNGLQREANDAMARIVGEARLRLHRSDGVSEQAQLDWDRRGYWSVAPQGSR